MTDLATEILTEHLEELGFLWDQRRQTLLAEESTAAHLRDIDARMAAHLDGLVLAGPVFFNLAVPALSGEDPGLAYAAAAALLEIGTPASLRLLSEALVEPPAAAWPGLACALAWGNSRPLAAELPRLFFQGAAPCAALAPVVAAVGRDPAVLDRLAELSAHEEPAVRAAAWRAIAGLPLTAAKPAP